jgi:methylated-DNA-[protein]-cysteine S-methyltransferase
MSDETLRRGEIDSPVGRIFWYERGGALCSLEFLGQKEHAALAVARLGRRFGAVTVKASEKVSESEIARKLARYLAGDIHALEGIRTDVVGTPFQKRVWQALRDIPAGRTTSYGEIARRVGAPKAVRAVGAANGRNPVALVVPCHRVIRSDGDLCGYAGGLERKRWLLAHEGAVC